MKPTETSRNASSYSPKSTTGSRRHTTLFLLLMAFGTVSCAVKPTQENFLRAVTEADIETLQALTEAGYSGAQPTLHTAVKIYSPQVFRFVLRAGHNIDSLSNDVTALMLASSLGKTDAVTELLALGSDPNARGSHGHTALSVVAAEHPEIAELLLTAGADPRAKNDKGQTVLEQLADKPRVIEVLTRTIKREEALIDAIKAWRLDEVSAYIDAGFRTNFLNNKGNSPLHYAVGFEKTDALTMLLKAGADPDIVATDGWTPLMWASDQGNAPAVKTLLGAGANLAIQQKDGWAALHLTVNDSRNAAHDYADIARLLIAAGANINTPINSGLTPLHLAISNKKPKTAAVLLDANADVDLPDKDGWTPLMTATYGGHADAVKALIAAKADPNLPSTTGRTALHFAAASTISEHDYAGIARLLVAAGANINARDNSGDTPLNLAAANPRPQVVTPLLEAGADTDQGNNEGWTPLIKATNNGDSALVDSLLKAHADPNLAENDGWTPLHFTVNKSNKPGHDYKEIANLLIAAGADVNARNNKGNTALAIAAMNKNISMAEVLLAGKADPDLANENGWTPLMQASDNGDLAMTRKLLSANANPDLAQPDGWTALHLTVNSPDDPEHDYPAVAKALLAAGANINIRNHEGSTTLYLAVMNRKLKTALALIAAKADPNIATNNGATPLLNAVNRGDLELTKKLLGAKADPNAATDDGWTALHLTVNESANPQHDYADIARLLLKSGAKSHLTNKNGLTPLMVAALNGKAKTAAVLAQRHADISLPNLQDGNRSAIDYAAAGGHYQIVNMLRSAGATSGLEEAKYPARPAARAGVITCNTRCMNGDCYRTYSDGRKVHFQAQQRFNPMSGQFEWDSGGC